MNKTAEQSRRPAARLALDIYVIDRNVWLVGPISAVDRNSRKCIASGHSVIKDFYAFGKYFGWFLVYSIVVSDYFVAA